MKTSLGLALLAFPILLACGPTAPTGTGGTGGGGKGGTGGTGGTGGGTSNGLPCNVDKVIKDKCGYCHGEKLNFGAPFSFRNFDEVSSHKDRIQARALDATGAAAMPPSYAPTGVLTDAEKTILRNWIASGAPRSGETCNNPWPDTSNRAGVEFLDCTPKPQHYFLAKGSGAGGKYVVPAGTKDRYVDFSFPNPFTSGEQAIAWAPVIDNPKIIHHYILYGGPSSTFVAGWAPGGTNAKMAPDLGLVLDYPSFRLQVHYNNVEPGAQNEIDGSGVAFCTTTTPRPNPVGIVTLGTIGISLPAFSKNVSVGNTCSKLSATGAPITIVAGSAHMHKLGVAFHTQLTGSTNAVVTVVPLDTCNFDNQTPQPTRERLIYRTGDKLTTTCTYSNTTAFPVGFGEGTTDEMCFDFMSVYPFNAANKLCMDHF